MLDFRVAVESGTVLLAAERVEKEQLERLEELVEKMAAELEDFEEYRRTDIRFHIGTRRGGAVAAADRGDDRGAGADDRPDRLDRAPARGARPLNEQHRRLIKELRKGDAARAVGAMREHTEGTEHILAGLLPPRLEARMRSPFGSKSGSEATSPSTQRPKISTSTGVPASAASGGR